MYLLQARSLQEENQLEVLVRQIEFRGVPNLCFLSAASFKSESPPRASRNY